MVRQILFGSMLAAVGFLAGCSGDNAAGPRAAGPSIEGSKFVLAAEPAGAKSVIALRKDAKDGDRVVIVGRIGGDKNPWIEGKAGFWIVDTSFKPCNEKEDDACPTPWDYCCDSSQELAKGTATIKFVDEQGKTLNVDARKLLDLKELNTVVVEGRAKRDIEGNLVVLASGVYRRPDAKKSSPGGE